MKATLMNESHKVIRSNVSLVFFKESATTHWASTSIFVKREYIKRKDNILCFIGINHRF